MAEFSMVRTIERTRQGEPLGAETVEALVAGFTRGDDPRLSDGGMADGRALARPCAGRSDHADDGDGPLRRYARSLFARSPGRGQAFDGRRRGQDDARRRADCRGVRRARREDERARPRPHGRHGGQTGEHPRLRPGTDRRAVYGCAAAVRSRARRAIGRPRPSGRQTLRACAM